MFQKKNYHSKKFRNKKCQTNIYASVNICKIFYRCVIFYVTLFCYTICNMAIFKKKISKHGPSFKNIKKKGYVLQFSLKISIISQSYILNRYNAHQS